ncbi:MAG: hypothetical protein HC802_08440 [Caldilineaceae bacterium]|nr:hypothetical protein [Caldilineaceae bacterium]
MAEGDEAEGEMAEGDEAEGEMAEGEMAEGDKMAEAAPEQMPETGAELSSTTTSISVVVLVLLGLVATTLFTRKRHA